MEHHGDSHQQVEKIWHSSDISQNWMFLQNDEKNNKKTGPRDCQEVCTNIKGPAGIFGNYWLYTTCDNNLIYF